MAFLKNKKTLITAGLIVVLAGLKQFLGIEIPGFTLSLGDAITVASGLVFAKLGTLPKV